VEATPGGPDWEALYVGHRGAMYRAASSMLARFGLTDRAGDAVQDAMESLMSGAQADAVDNWEALMVKTAIRRAIDIGKTAAVRHDGGGLSRLEDVPGSGDFTEAVDDEIYREQVGAVLWDKLAILNERERYVIREFTTNGRPRTEVAEKLGVSPGRVSQLSKQALVKLRRALQEEGYE
jgi:RNA polymerase sigma factor (sigma-70 family)